MRGFPHSSVCKESAYNAGDPGSIPGSGRFPGGSNGNPLQHSYLENPTDRGDQQASGHGVARVRHDLAMKPPPPCISIIFYYELSIKYAHNYSIYIAHKNHS